MSYAAAINRANPTAFMFLIDQSRSMNEKMDVGASKAQFVGDVLNKTLFQLIGRCTSADGVQDYFDIGALAYSGTGVHSGFGGALSASALHPISSLAAHPLRIEERKKRVPDGAGGLVDQSVKFPVWINSVSVGDAPMCEGFRKAAECLVSWCNSHVKSHPPTIIHVTGGPSTDGNPEQLGEAIRHISTNVGRCLLFNLHVDASGSAAVLFPASEASLSDTYSKMLFRMSSLLPTHLIKPAQEKGYSASAQSRFFGYKAGYEDIVNFFDIGTRVSNLLLREPMSPPSEQTSVRPITGSRPDIKSHQVDPPSAAAAKSQPPKPASKTVGREQRPIWSQGVRALGLAIVVLAGIVLFKLFATGGGPKPTQVSNQTPTISSKEDSAPKRQSGDNGQSIGLSGGPNVPAADTSERGSALLPDSQKIAPPADPGPKLAAGTEQTTEPANVPALMPPPKNIDQPKEAEASAANPSSAAANLDLAKVPDAKRVQQRLIELGYFSGPASGVWGLKSRGALSEFRTAENLGQDDHWDQATEGKLFSTSTARKQQSLAFVGGWSKDASSCADAPIKITASRAMS